MLPRVVISFRVLSLVMALGCAGCEDMFAVKAPPRDFNELIPRLLGAISNRTPEDAAANLFNVTSPDERRDAIAYLETRPYGHGEPYMRAYEILTTDPHPMVRAQAMRALGSSHQDVAVDYLLKGLNDADVQVRRDSAYGLSFTFGDQATAALSQHLKQDPDTQVRVFSAQALRWAHSPDAIRALIDALDDKDAAVVYYAHRSLVLLTGQDQGIDSVPWLTWYQQTYHGPATQANP